MAKTSKTTREQFTFYLSYFDALNELESDEDKVQYLMAICNKQFYGIEPINLSKDVRLVYKSQKHSMDKSIIGWESQAGVKLQPPTGGTTQVPYQGSTQVPHLVPSVQVQEQEQVQVQVQEQEQVQEQKEVQVEEQVQVEGEIQFEKKRKLRKDILDLFGMAIPEQRLFKYIAIADYNSIEQFTGMEITSTDIELFEEYNNAIN